MVSKNLEIHRTQKRMSMTERKASKIPTLQKQLKSLNHSKQRETNEIHKIIRLGKTVDKKDRLIEKMKIEYKKLENKYEAEMHNILKLRERLSEMEFKLKRPSDQNRKESNKEMLRHGWTTENRALSYKVLP